MDAFFSPVLEVGLKVENVRVGKMTNWDKLILHVKTDGTITYQEAFTKAVNILIDQFSALISPLVAEETVAAEIVAEGAGEVLASETEETAVEDDTTDTVKVKKTKKTKK